MIIMYLWLQQNSICIQSMQDGCLLCGSKLTMFRFMRKLFYYFTVLTSGTILNKCAAHSLTVVLLVVFCTGGQWAETREYSLLVQSRHQSGHGCFCYQVLLGFSQCKRAFIFCRRSKMSHSICVLCFQKVIISLQF